MDMIQSKHLQNTTQFGKRMGIQDMQTLLALGLIVPNLNIRSGEGIEMSLADPVTYKIDGNVR